MLEQYDKMQHNTFYLKTNLATITIAMLLFYRKGTTYQVILYKNI
jgi:hypothetical protein